MALSTSVLSSLLLLAAVAGCACGPCSEGRTFANAVISPNLETTRIAWVPQSSPVADCTAACCDLARCDLAWWFEGRCYLVSCPRPESCEPREVGSVRSYLTFVRRPARGPSQLLRYREMVLRRRSPSGLWGDSPESLRKDLSPLGPALRLRRASEYPDDYRDPELDPFQPLSKQEPRGSAEYTDWGLFPGGPSAGDNLPWVAEEQEVPEWGPEEETEYSDDYRDPEQDPFQPLSQQEPRGSAEYTDWGPFPSGPSAGDGLPRAAEKQEDPVLRPLNGSARPPAPERSSESRTSPSWVTDPPSREALGKETVHLQDAPSSDSGEEVLMPSSHPSPARLEFSPASTVESPLLTVPTRSLDHGAPTRPASLVPAEPSPSEQPASPTTAPRTVKELLVWAGENRIVTLPEHEVDLKASVVPAPPAETTYSYEWSLVSHPGDYQDEIKERHTQTLNLSHLSAGLYAFKVAVSSDSAFGEGFVNVTVKPARRVNLPPTAVVSPQTQALTLPLTSAFIDGSQSTDDTKIVSYLWEEISGPSREEKTPADSPILRLSNLIPGNYTFRLTVADSDGATNSTTAALIVNSAVDHPPVANAGPDQTITLPQNSITLNGNQSSDDHQIVLYEWSLGPGNESKEVAMQDVIGRSDHSTALQLTNLVEGVYTFRLQVVDGQGALDTDTATVEVRPDPRKSALVELILQVGVGRLTEQQKDTLVRRLAALLNVLDSDVKVQKIQAHSDLSTIIVFYVQSGPPFKVLKAADVVRNLHRRLSKEKADFLLFKVLRIDTAGCLLRCSGHGHCDPITKRCVCSQLWMENLIQRYLQDGESNCEWSVFYVAALALTVLGLTGGMPWLCLYCRRRKRIKIRKKTKYTILDSVDEQESMELRPKHGIKHRSTEHNSSLMVSESEFDSDQDTIFSEERMERGNAKVSVSGSLRHGAPFSYCSKDR
ncbi:dyslexia-associated protein KIAA0319 homolog isoform X4 [Mustela erminea]|uniref:dyslexia-associated protein KIAA0319 homolog isoform X4 n=1 Tax=Mustela erminea TaxID=36723 RepID=UPI0013868BF5|nr:dyslexia-associated protein KIAA0319 homolog isoform X4 [Mustela erminea]